MQLSLYTYNGNAINDGSNYTAVIPPGQTMPAASGQWVDRGQSWPYLAGKNLQGSVFTFKLILRGTIPTQMETLKSWFRTDDFTLRTLIAKDTSDSDRQWYVKGFPINPPTFTSSAGGSEMLVQLALEEPLWREVTEQTSTWSITASGQTTSPTVRGNYTALPTIEITPTSAKTGNYAYKRFVTVYNNTNEWIRKYPLCISGAGLGTAALVTAGKMLASGDDLRVFVNGREVDRWLYAMNTTATMIWINLNFKSKIEMTLGTAMAGTGTPATIQMSRTNANKLAIAAMPQEGLVLIGSELISYSAVDTNNLILTLTERASRNTSMAVHAIGATVRWIQHDIYIQYGNSSATAPTADDTEKPIIELGATTTNSVWKYTEFLDDDGLRSGNWSKERLSGAPYRQAYGYEGNHMDMTADPATEMGAVIQSYSRDGIVKAGSGEVLWSLYHPAGITSFTANLDRYRAKTNWPAVTFEKSRDGNTWVPLYTVATPAGAAAWTTLAVGSVAAGDYKYLGWRIEGTVAASASNYIAAEVDDITLTLTASGIPTVTVGSETTNNYMLEATITNTTTNESITLTTPLALNQKLTINCQDQTVKKADGSNVIRAIDWSSVRSEWLTLKTGESLQYTETGAVALTIGLKWRGRGLL